jgi:twitching motility protein PilT
VLAAEILVANLAVRTLVRERDFHKLISVMETGRRAGMQTMDQCLRDLYERAEISYDTALTHARDPNSLRLGETQPSEPV